MPISSITGQKIINTLVPANCKTTANGTGIAVDTYGYGEVLMVANHGISLDTLSGSIYWTITFEECETTTAGSFTHIVDTELEGGGHSHVIDAAAEDPTLVVRRYKGKMRYVRIVWTQTGTHTNGTPLAGTIILSDPVHFPVTQETELGTDA